MMNAPEVEDGPYFNNVFDGESAEPQPPKPHRARSARKPASSSKAAD